MERDRDVASQHSNTGQRSMHCQKKGLGDFLLPLGVKALPGAVKRGVSRKGHKEQCLVGKKDISVYIFF